jgi:hypothetical protein
VNNPPVELVIQWFIRDSLPCVSLLGVSSTRLDNATLQARHLKGWRLHIVGRLLAEGLVVVVVMAFGWWGMTTLGNYTLASEGDPLTAMGDSIYVAGCPVAETLQKSSAGGGVGKGCSEGGSSDPITSRQPGVGLAKHGHGAER